MTVCCVCCLPCALQGFLFADRISEWQLPTDSRTEVQVNLRDHIGSDHLPSALRNALHQLQSLAASNAEINLWVWHWTPGLVDIVGDEVPLLEHLKFWINIPGALTDELLRPLLRLPSHVRMLIAGSLDVRSDEFKDAAWPWQEVHFGTLDAAGLLRLPNPATFKRWLPNLVFGTLDLSGVDLVSIKHACMRWMWPHR